MSNPCFTHPFRTRFTPPIAQLLRGPVWLLLAAMILACMGLASATEYTRLTEADAVGTWADNSKWTPDTGSPTTIADQAILNVGSTQRAITFDAGATVSQLGIGYDLSGASNLFSNIAFSAATATSLNVGDATTIGTATIGGGGTSATETKTGTLALGANITLNVQGASGSALYLGAQAGNGPVTVGTLTMAADSALNIGTSSVRGSWIIGHQGSLTAATSSGTFTATGGDLNAFLTSLVVGQNIRGSGSASHKSVGSLDLTGLASASIDTTSLTIGSASDSQAQGTMILGSGQTLTVSDSAAGTINIGTRGSTGGSGPATNTVEGLLELTAGATVSIGNLSNRAALNIATSGNSRGTNIITEGTITAAANSNFSAYLSNVVIGSQNATVALKTYQAAGSMDLRLANVTAFDVSGSVIIGNGTGAGSQGELRLPQISGSVGSLLIGNTDVGGGGQESSSGLLDLQGAHLTVAGSTSISTTGQITVAVAGNSAGLRLADINTLSILNLGSSSSDPAAGYHINFADPEASLVGIYYGLAWEGDHLAELTSLVNSFAITWTNSMADYTPQLAYDAVEDLTYIGAVVIPEPSTLMLAAFAAAAFAVFRSRRQGNKTAGYKRASC